jgi:hypothetical protein
MKLALIAIAATALTWPLGAIARDNDRLGHREHERGRWDRGEHRGHGYWSHEKHWNGFRWVLTPVWIDVDTD